jgi:hypothetical protein
MSIISRILFFLLLWAAPALAANPAFVAGTVNSGSGLSVTTVTVTSTGSVTVGDIMLVTIVPVGAASAPTAITPPAGWSTALATTTVGASNASAAVFWKLQAASGAFSGAFTWTTTGAGATWTFSEWSGANTTLPLDGTATISQNASSANPTSPSITPAAGNTSDTLVGFMIGDATGVATTVTKPTTMSTVVIVNESTTVPLTGAASLALASAAATGTKQWTLSGAEVTLGVSLLLQPAGGGTACQPMNLLGVGC